MSNGHRGGRRMAKHWHSIAASTAAATVDVTTIGAVLALDGPWTVIRMIGEYCIFPTNNVVAGDHAEVSVGIGVISSDAAAAGSASAPDPGSEPEFPWLYWSSHEFFFRNTSAPAPVAR